MKLTGLAPVMMLSRTPKIISPGIRRFLGLFEALRRIGCIAHCECHSEPRLSLAMLIHKEFIISIGALAQDEQ